MAQSDNHPDPKTRQGQQHQQELAPNLSIVPSGQNAGRAPAVKILTHIHFHPAQHGFRPKHSNCIALSTITADIATDFSRKMPAHRTVLVAHALTAAFDNVDHQQLLDCVININMQKRRAKVHFQQRRIERQKGENRSGTRRSSVSSSLQLLSGRFSDTASEHEADQVRR